MRPIQAAYKFIEQLKNILGDDKYELMISTNDKGDGVVNIVQKSPLKQIKTIYFEDEISVKQIDNMVKDFNN